MLGATALNAGLRAPHSLSSSHRLNSARKIAGPQAIRGSRHLGHRSRVCETKAIAEAEKPSSSSPGPATVLVDNTGADDTIITLVGENRPGELQQTCPTLVLGKNPWFFTCMGPFKTLIRIF